MIMRPGTAGSARGAGNKVIFGRSYSNQNLSSNCAKQAKKIPQQALSRDTLTAFNAGKTTDRNVEEAIDVD